MNTSVNIGMSKREHRIYFSSSFCDSDNKKGRFLVHLPFSLELQGEWKCAIRDIFITNKNILPKFIYILSDFCETSIVYGKEQLPILKKIFIDSSEKYLNSEEPLYIPLKQTQLNKFELRFINPQLEEIDFGDKFLIECTIHFYKDG